VNAVLGDTPSRDYSHKLDLFNAFAKPEIRQLISNLALERGMRILDAGCGTGDALLWFQQVVGAAGSVVGVDLSEAHVAIARERALPQTQVFQCDLLQAPLELHSFDLIWCVNTVNHLRDRTQAAKHLTAFLRPGGRLVFGQSSLLPDMYFAWDSRLERITNEAVRSYYRQRYQLEETDLASVRNLLGLLRSTGLRNPTVRTVVIERVPPIDADTRAYLEAAIFRGTWGDHLRPYVPADDFDRLACLCDPDSPQYALRRPDFHFLQTFTLAVGEIA
jgi:ubiquinone/menaquinone biosynthesis C-methylase UbiE